MLNAGTTISRNVADTNPALIVNLANASASGNIQVWQKAGSAVANIDGLGRFFTTFIGNYSNANNSRIFLNTTGTEIGRDVADTNPALIVNKNQGTGNIFQLQSAGANKLEVDVNGWFYQNGTRFIHANGWNDKILSLDETSGGSASHWL
jgi:hypothetical protein